MLHPDLIFRSSVAGTIGLFLGIVVSLVVNCTLVEISISAFFSLYFGILFIVVGVIILWRVKVHSSVRESTLNVFGMLVIVSGCMCFFLENKWYFHLSPLVKIPMYTLLGVAVSFALTFSVVDMINYVLGFLQTSVAKPLVESVRQIQLVLLVALIMGGIFGFIFGLMDIEDAVQYQIRLRLLKQEHYCFPIGGLLGSFAGVGNEYLRELDAATPSYSSVFDEDI
eukprot:GEMP01056787.1.p1 GENE.GEMP01056787.1~~GEMP01056787.1.p1  ORF type:complete len:225 (+),score=24.92 GEMP01056787.1:77-751(+)